MTLLHLNQFVSLSLLVILKVALLLGTAEGLSQLKWTWYRRERPLADLQRYDMASREPIRSFRLSWSLRGRHSIFSVARSSTAGHYIDKYTNWMLYEEYDLVADECIYAAKDAPVQRVSISWRDSSTSALSSD
jgi:Protein of unknown function (DUF3176)